MSKRTHSTSTRSLKIPPSSVEAEQAVLGGLMISPDSLDLVSSLITESDFYRRDHRLIYRAICELAEKNTPFDAVTLGEWFEAHALSEQVGGSGYLIELASTTPSAANIKAYAEIVADRYALRRLIEVGTTIVNDGFNPEGRTSAEVISDAERSIFALNQSGIIGREHVMPASTVMSESFRVLQDRYESDGKLTGVSTGFSDFDDLTTGLQPSDLIIIAGRPSMGKTALALQIGEHAAIHQKKTVLVYSMEMAASQLGFRLISSVGRVNAERLRTGQLEDSDWALVTTAVSKINASKLFIDESPGLSPELLRARARRIKREHDLGLIVVDYLQLMTSPGTNENRATEIAAISRSLKNLAKELKVPVIALSQLNRGLESRTDKRPTMSDLRESGSIEQDADLIAFIYRDEYYNRDSEDKGLAEIIIAKQRNGPTGYFKLRFFGEYTRFEQLSKDNGTFE